VCRNHELKCAVVESAHRTLRNKVYNYFTNNNTYRYVNMLQLFIKAENETEHTAHGMSPTAVTAKHLLGIGPRMNERRSRVRVGKINSM